MVWPAQGGIFLKPLIAKLRRKSIIMTISPENVAQHLKSMGYSAKAGTMTDRKTGEPQQVVYINGLGSINAYLNLSPDPEKFGLKVFGNLQDGYAPVVLDDHGELVRETVMSNGQRVTRAKRGEPLDAEGLKQKNNEISLAARKEITAAVLAAYMLEVGGGDLDLIRSGFRLQKWERPGTKASAEATEMGDATIADASAAFEAAAEDRPVDASAAQKSARTRRAKGLGL